MPPEQKLVEQIRMVVMNELEKQRIESDIDKAIVSDAQVREIIREELPAFLAKSITSIEGNLQLLDGRNIIVGGTSGTRVGTATTQKIGFYNTVPIAQRSGAAQAAVATTAATQTTPWGYTTQAQADAIVTLVNELRAWAVAQGLIKGSA